MSNLFTRLKSSITIGLTVVTLVGAIAGVQISQTAQASAAEACDKVNIIYCGLDGNNDETYAAALKAAYNKGSNNGHDDLQAVYNWSGATASDIAGLSATNTKVGTLYRNGDVKVGGDVVATDAWVSARFTEGDGFVKIKDGVWARKTTTSFANPSARVLVHYDENNQVDFVVMVDCGNAVKVTPVKVKPPVVTPPVQECKPGVPVGSPACTECKPGVPAGSTECNPTPVVETPAPVEAPTELVNAGPGAIVGMFAGTSALGAIGHNLISRRRNRD
jgi:hypothetical protein